MSRAYGAELAPTAESPYMAAVADAAAARASVPGPPAENGWRSNWIARHRIGVFLVLAFAFSWWPWPAAVLNPESSAMVSFGPIIAAFVVTAVAGGRRQVVGLLRAVVRWRVPWSRYVIALAGPFLIAGVTGVIAMAFEITQPFIARRRIRLVHLVGATAALADDGCFSAARSSRRSAGADSSWRSSNDAVR